jgi:hypothetical protein
VLNHRNVLLSRSLSHYVSQENHLEYHSISTLYTEENNTSFHLRLRENDTPNSWASSPHTGAHSVPSPSQRGTTHPSHGHTQLMGFLTPHRGTQRSFSVSERNNTPISWAHPTHGLSLRPTHSDCVLEDVSHSCNHQHSLSAREAFSTRPSFSWKYSNFVLASGLVKMFAICSCVGRYCTCVVFLCTMSLI